MIDAVVTPPAKNQPARNKRRDIPPDLLEEILLRLPMKSLFRFSSTSKSWNSMILGSCFVNRYRGRQMIVFKPEMDGHLRNASVCPLSSLSIKNPLEGATPLSAPFEGRPYLVASCDDLWCVQVKNSLILWNPSFPTFRKLPEPWLPPWSKLPPWSGPFRYGLGFDSVNDDYKMLKIFTHKVRGGRVETELYCLKSNSWRKIQPFPERKIKSKFGLFVSGVLHWLVAGSMGKYVIIYFDLSTEKYGGLALPNIGIDGAYYDLEMRVLRGMLCLCVNYRDVAKYEMWVIKDYEIRKSWSKEVEINYGEVQAGNCLRPLDFYNDDRNLVTAVISSLKKAEVFTYKKLAGKESQVEVMNAGDTINGNVNIFNSLTYVAKPSVAGYLADFRRRSYSGSNFDH